MSIVAVSVISVLVICALAHRADASFHSEDRLPMQWGVTGEVTWSAPRRVALAFMPALSLFQPRHGHSKDRNSTLPP